MTGAAGRGIGHAISVPLRLWPAVMGACVSVGLCAGGRHMATFRSLCGVGRVLGGQLSPPLASISLLGSVHGVVPAAGRASLACRRVLRGTVRWPISRSAVRASLWHRTAGMQGRQAGSLLCVQLATLCAHSAGVLQPAVAACGAFAEFVADAGGRGPLCVHALVRRAAHGTYSGAHARWRHGLGP